MSVQKFCSIFERQPEDPSLQLSLTIPLCCMALLRRPM